MIQFEMPRQQRYQLVADDESDMPEWAEEYTICNLRSGSDPGPYMFCGGEWVMLSSYAVRDGTLKIYHDVKAGDQPWDGDASEVKSVVIADTVKSIGAGAFTSLEDLEYVSIPAGVEVEDGAFSQTFKDPFDADIAMADVAGYEYVAYEGVMYQCDPDIFTYNATSTVVAGFVGSGVKNVVLPRKKGETTLIAVGGNAFKNQTGIVRLMAVPDMGMTSYYTSAFEGCTSLTDVVLPDSMTALGERAFYGCTSLVKVTVPDTLDTMWASVFYNCTSLRSLSFTNILKILGTGVFANCGEMSSFRFPATMTQIGAGCFSSCTGVTEVSFETGFNPTLGAGCFGTWTFYAADGTTQLDKTVASNLAGKTFKGSASRLVEDAGPVPGMEGRYMYAITTDSAGMNILSVQAGHDGRPLDTIVTASTRRQGAENIPHEWDFVNGVGPFKCWYGAFNIQDYVAGTEDEEPVRTGAGMLAYRLDPYDLGMTMGGTTLQGTYNVFLVVPTVYWKAVGNILYLSDDASYAGITGMTAYAHTATLPDTTQSVYPYIGIGVYEGSEDNSTILSIPNASISSGKTPEQYKTLVDALVSTESSDFQIMNLWHWMLIKIMCYTVIGTKNGQWALGTGPCNNPALIDSGLSEKVGPYADATSQYSKVFIEDIWGNSWNIIGDADVNAHVLYAGKKLGGASLGGDQPMIEGATLPEGSAQYITSVYLASEIWDLPKTVGESSSTDPACIGDFYWSASTTGYKVIRGFGARDAGYRAGIAAMPTDFTINITSVYTGVRLSAFFDGTAMGTPEVTTKAAPAPTRSMEEEALPEAERDEPAEEPVEELVEEESDEGSMDIEGL